MMKMLTKMSVFAFCLCFSFFFFFAFAASDLDEVPVIHYAILSGKAEFVQWLLDSGASPHSADGLANTPLHVATRAGCADVALALLKRGCQPNARNLNGETPVALWLQAVRDPPVLMSTICVLGIFGARDDVRASSSLFV